MSNQRSWSSMIGSWILGLAVSLKEIARRNCRSENSSNFFLHKEDGAFSLANKSWRVGMKKLAPRVLRSFPPRDWERKRVETCVCMCCVCVCTYWSIILSLPLSLSLSLSLVRNTSIFIIQSTSATSSNHHALKLLHAIISDPSPPSSLPSQVFPI